MSLLPIQWYSKMGLKETIDIKYQLTLAALFNEMHIWETMWDEL